MLLNKNNLDVADCTSNDLGRPALNGVHITSEYVEGSNGHIFARVSFPKTDVDDFPTIAGLDKITPLAKGCDLLLSGEAVGKLRKDLPKAKITKTLPILKHVLLNPTPDERDKVAAGTTDLDSTVVRRIPVLGGPYPSDIDKKVIPTGKPKATIHLNAGLLIDLLLLAQNYREMTHGVTLEFYAGTKKRPDPPMVLKTSSVETGQDFLGLIMPLRIEK